MTVEAIAKYREETDANCAEAVLYYANMRYHLGIADADYRLVGGFGGGMACGGVCGALAGAIAVIGVLMVPVGQVARKSEAIRPCCKRLVELFSQHYPSDQCKDIRPDYIEREHGCAWVIHVALESLHQVVEENDLLTVFASLQTQATV